MLAVEKQTFHLDYSIRFGFDSIVCKLWRGNAVHFMHLQTHRGVCRGCVPKNKDFFVELYGHLKNLSTNEKKSPSCHSKTVFFV